MKQKNIHIIVSAMVVVLFAITIISCDEGVQMVAPIVEKPPEDQSEDTPSLVETPIIDMEKPPEDQGEDPPPPTDTVRPTVV